MHEKFHYNIALVFIAFNILLLLLSAKLWPYNNRKCNNLMQHFDFFKFVVSGRENNKSTFSEHITFETFLYEKKSVLCVSKQSKQNKNSNEKTLTLK